MVFKITPEQHYAHIRELDEWWLTLPHDVKADIHRLVSTVGHLEQSRQWDRTYAKQHPDTGRVGGSE